MLSGPTLVYFILACLCVFGSEGLRAADVGLRRRLVGGVDIQSGQYPFIVDVFVSTDGQRRQCLGTLVEPTAVLTTAQCMMDIKGQVRTDLRVEVVVGSTEDLPTIEGTHVRVQNYTIHPNYTANALANNLAVVYLVDAAPLSKTVGTVKVYNELADEGHVATVVGANPASTSAGHSPGTLQAAEFSVGTVVQCQSLVGNYYTNGPILCAPTKPSNDLCEHDGGAPLLINQDSAWYLSGFMSGKAYNSTNTACGQPGGLAYFTRVAYYLPWLTTDGRLTAKDVTFGTGGEPAAPPANVTTTDDTIASPVSTGGTSPRNSGPITGALLLLTLTLLVTRTT
ncbi:hypothetical protein IWQ60_002491 [Tieghemiomyces parasiticus]|uniref:Peptidase S1 domain-containing protein n=1 Tax=Tieghemiomyces parasiticus TaxID=78921 RepID=A0A9W8AEP3_9FUNG|nr:hypothetical protein IWQ60_002491 [Tieghemiomyces parasiticus]